MLDTNTTWLTSEKQRHRLKWILSKFCLWAVPVFHNTNTYLYNLTDTIFLHEAASHVLQTQTKLFQISPKYLRNPLNNHQGCRLIRTESSSKLQPLHEPPPNNLKSALCGLSIYQYLLQTWHLWVALTAGGWCYPRVRTLCIVPSKWLVYSHYSSNEQLTLFHSLNLLHLSFLVPVTGCQPAYHSITIPLPMWIYIPTMSGSSPQLKLAAVASLPSMYQQGHYHKKLFLFPNSSSWIQIPELAHTDSYGIGWFFQRLLTWPNVVMFSYCWQVAHPSQRIYIHTKCGKILSKKLPEF